MASPIKFISLCFLLVNCAGEPHIPNEMITDIVQPTVQDKPEFVYGIPTDSFNINSFTFKNGQTLSGILSESGLNHSTISNILTSAEPVLEVNKIRVGNPYTIFCKPDENGLPVCMVYEENKWAYVVFDWRDTLPHVYRVEKKKEEKTLTASGIIQHSLYETVIANGYDPAICMEMASILKWSIDFFALQNGDKFKLVYKAWMADNEYLGLSQIKALSFTHKNKTFNAFHHEFENQQGYYDENGLSLKSRFLKAPLEFTRISSGFSMNRMHPILKRNKPHLGTDYAAPSGTPVVSVADGTITDATFASGNGNFVKIKHDNVYTTQYLHLSKFGPGIKKGTKVIQGQVIGYVGATGLATGPHLCFRFWKNGSQVDPYKEDLNVATPLPKNEMNNFTAQKNLWSPILNQLNYQEAILASSASLLKNLPRK
jgi:murein DD-endopeptidase MepM/ murein hydrolase activator NlpD